MRLVSRITRFFYLLILAIIGLFLILVALNVVQKERFISLINLVYLTPNLRLAAGFAGLLLIAVCLLIIQLALGKLRREKTIAFDNPDGEVTVALPAIENFMKGLSRQIPQIKELRPNVVAGKKGIIIDVKVSLYSDINIPNVAETIQSLVKGRVQEMLGIEDPIVVKVHIAKILHKEEPKKKKKPQEEKQEMPFRPVDYGAE